jgi:hypothetical protein
MQCNIKKKMFLKNWYIVYMMINIDSIQYNHNIITFNIQQEINIINIISFIISMIFILIIGITKLYPCQQNLQQENLQIFLRNKSVFKYNEIINYLEYNTTENIDLNLFEYPRLYVYALIQRASNINPIRKINIDRNNIYLKATKNIYRKIIRNIKLKVQNALQNNKIYTNINPYIGILLGSYLTADSLQNLLILLNPFDITNQNNLFLRKQWEILQNSNYTIKVVYPIHENDAVDLKFFGHINGIRKWYTVKIVSLE